MLCEGCLISEWITEGRTVNTLTLKDAKQASRQGSRYGADKLMCTSTFCVDFRVRRLQRSLCQCVAEFILRKWLTRACQTRVFRVAAAHRPCRVEAIDFGTFGGPWSRSLTTCMLP